MFKCGSERMGRFINHSLEIDYHYLSVGAASRMAGGA